MPLISLKHSYKETQVKKQRKQSLGGVFVKNYFENMHQIYRAPMMKCDFNEVAM